MRKLQLVLLAAILVGACDAAITPSQQPASVIATPPPAAGASLAPGASPGASSVPEATPAPDPEAVRKAAAAAYLAAAKKSTKATDRLAKRYKVFRTLKRARAYYRQEAKLSGEFIHDIKGIAVPADTAADLHDLVRRWTADQALELEGSVARSWAEIDDVQAATRKSYRKSTAAANLLRADLGLPPVKF